MPAHRSTSLRVRKTTSSSSTRRCRRAALPTTTSFLWLAQTPAARWSPTPFSKRWKRQLRRPCAALFQRQRFACRAICWTRFCRRNCSTSTATSRSPTSGARILCARRSADGGDALGERAGLYLALDQQEDGVLEVLSAPDISDFVTNLRNRQVDVTVALDTSYASRGRSRGTPGQGRQHHHLEHRNERRRR